MSAESRIQELELTLPPSVPSGGIYKPLVIFSLLFFSYKFMLSY